MATSAQAIAAHWVDRSTAARKKVTANASRGVAAGWAAYAAWYEAAAVAEQGGSAAAVSLAAQEAATGAAAQYVAEVVAALRGDQRTEVPKVVLAAIRNGADLSLVHSRPARVYRETFALTGDAGLARERAVQRSRSLVAADVTLAARSSRQQAMTGLGVTRYRRVLRPELAETGTCGLCIVAADRLYRVKDLLPIHDRCGCETIPVAGGQDVGPQLNQDDLKKLYAAAGDSTEGEDLKRVRVAVNEHGELGPVLTVRGQRFTGPDDLGRPPGNPDLSRQRLAKLNAILAQLEQRSRSGEHLDGALDYQRQQIERTSRYTAA